MSVLTGRLLFLLLALCFVASVCEARGGRGGGGRARFRGGYRGSSGGSSGGGSLSTGAIIGIVCGVIGGTIFIVVIYYVCKSYMSSSSSVGSAKYNSNGVAFTTPRSNTTPSSNYTTSNDYTTPYKTNDMNGEIPPPPTYDSAVQDKGDNLPYSANPSEGFSYPPAPAYGFSADVNAYPSTKADS